MSTAISTVPAWLKKLIRPSADTVTVTAFGVAGCPATQFRFDANGYGLSAGNTVRYDDPVGLTATTSIDKPVAPAGIVQSPSVPHTGVAYVSCGPSGVERDPTTSAGRVSSNRHGVIGTNDESPGEPDADALNSPPAPTRMATTAPPAAHRERPSDPPRTRPNMTTIPSLAAPRGPRPTMLHLR